VSEDFVCLLFDDGDMAEDLITGIELSATEHALQRLRAKGLLPSDLTGVGMDASEPLEGLEVAVSIPLDAGHVAAVFVLEGDLCGAAPLPGVREPWVLGRTMELSRDPYVVAGSLPRGAVRAHVRDGRGAWHEAAAGPGAWICRLGQPGRGDVAVRYLDAAGGEVRIPDDDFGMGVPKENEALDQAEAHADRVLAGAQVPLLWPRQIGGEPELFAWSGPTDAAEAVGLIAHGCRLWIGGESSYPRAVFREHLLRDWNYEAQTATQRAQEIAITELPGSIAGTPARFELATPAESWMADEGWAATITVPGLTAAITGFESPPERLDLEPLR
jgi:hypothetical protein